MYKNFFGLKELPFNFSPDPRYLYWTPAAQEALSALTYGIESRKGFILLTGEVGTGKTTLLNGLVDWLRENDIATAFVFNSQLSSAKQLFDFMLADFGITCESRLKSHVLLKLNQWLLDRYRAGKTTVLIVDEAQNLSEQLLEEIRLLTNLETSTEKLLQIVLSGQPELDEKLNRPQLRQLLQRIVFRCRTVPLTQEETHGYVTERLRVINLLCEHALINSFAERINPIPAKVVEEIAREFTLGEFAPVPRPVVRLSADREPGERVEGLLRDMFSYLRPADQPQPLTGTSRERKS